MKEALHSAFIIVLWVAFWLAGTLVSAVLQARLIDIGVLSDIHPPWIITTEPTVARLIDLIFAACPGACRRAFQAPASIPWH
jgi:hypothetical protein